MDIKLNKLQQEAYDNIIKGHNVFITGSAGTGKSVVIQFYRERNMIFKNIGVTSTTGVSAIVIGGTTLHSYLGIGIGTDNVENLIRKINKNKKIKNRWKTIDVLIIDEISMLSPELFDKIEEIARKMRYIKNIPDKPFGGIQLILTGDFLQLPVVKNDHFCFESKSWNNCIEKTIYLTEIVRQNDKSFQNILNEIRFGFISTEAKKILNSRIGIKLKNDKGIKPTRIYTTNVSVDMLNEDELNKLENEEGLFEYEMNYDFYDYNLTTCDKNRLIEKYTKSCLAPDKLLLCRGAQVMLLANLDIEHGLANGSRGIVIDFIENIPIVRFMNGQEKIMEYYSWDIKEGEDVIMRINQIPLKLAWAFTIHKSQSITLDYAEIDLGNMFTYGQAYVGLSRVKNIEGLSIIEINYGKIQAHPKAIEYYNRLITEPGNV